MLAQVKSLDDFPRATVKVGNKVHAESQTDGGCWTEPNWQAYFDDCQAASNDAELLDILFGMRLDAVCEDIAMLRTLVATQPRMVATVVDTTPWRTPGMLYTKFDTDFVGVGMEMEWQKLSSLLEELIWWTARWEVRLLCMPDYAPVEEYYIGSDDEDGAVRRSLDTGGSVLGFDDVVRLTRDHRSWNGSRVHKGEYCKVRGSPDAPEKYNLEAARNVWVTARTTDLVLVEKAQWPD